MRYYRQRGFEHYFDIIGGTIFSLLLVIGIGVWLGTYVPFWLPYVFWLIYISAVIASVTAVWIVPNALSRFRHKRKKCIHGISGGDTDGRCPLCKELRLREAQENEQAVLRSKQLAEMRRAAESLEWSELKRLTQVRLKSRDFLLSLSPMQFEDIVSEMFRKLGYKIEQTPYSNDQGKDARLWQGDILYLAEYKRYDSKKRIGRPHLQKLFAAMNEENAKGGFFITTSDFAATAVAYAKIHKIVLVNADELSRLMHKAFPDGDTADEVKVMCTSCGELHTFSLECTPKYKRCSCGADVQSDISSDSIAIASILHHRLCPRCGKQLRIVRGYRGKFWGCSGYPKCKYTRPFS